MQDYLISPLLDHFLPIRALTRGFEEVLLLLVGEDKDTDLLERHLTHKFNFDPDRYPFKIKRMPPCQANRENGFGGLFADIIMVAESIEIDMSVDLIVNVVTAQANHGENVVTLTGPTTGPDLQVNLDYSIMKTCKLYPFEVNREIVDYWMKQTKERDYYIFTQFKTLVLYELYCIFVVSGFQKNQPLLDKLTYVLPDVFKEFSKTLDKEKS